MSISEINVILTVSMSFDSVSLTIVRCSILFKNMRLIVSDVMIREKNKTLISIKDFKFCFHKLLKNDTQRWKCFKKHVSHVLN